MKMDDIAYTRTRLQKAEMIADSLRHDDRLHGLALEAVFAIEDRLFLLEEAAAGDAAQQVPSTTSEIVTAAIIPFPSRAARVMARAC